MTLTFTQGHNCVSNLTNALPYTVIVISRIIFKVCHSNLARRYRLLHGIYTDGHSDDLDLDSSDTIQVIIIKLGTVTASDMVMHHVFIIDLGLHSRSQIPLIMNIMDLRLFQKLFKQSPSHLL